MWHTPRGDRQLIGPEAELVRAGLAMLVDQVSTWAEMGIEDPAERVTWHTRPFDLLTTTQQLAVLYEVARHLLTATPTTLPLTEVTESTIAAIFDQIHAGIDLEIDEQGDDPDDPYADLLSWRAQIRAAYKASLSEHEWEELAAQGFELPAVDDPDIEQWRYLIERLADRILWDRDYEMASLLLDAAPEKADQMKQILGVNQSYFTEIAPEIRQQDVGQLLKKIKAITHLDPW
jgi:hypothetical protein